MVSRGPLAGVRILDLSRLLPGPYCTQLLADLGATVTKFENLDTLGDPLRHYPPLASDGNSAMFHALNRGKRSVALPFRDPSTPAKVESLLRETDVLVESFKPGTLESLLGRQDIADLLRDFPNLVVCRLSGYGQQCSDDVGGHDLNFVAAAGVLGMAKKKGSDRGKPLPVQWADLAGGAWPAALQIVAALYKRDNNSDRATGGSATTTTTTISSSISSSSSSGGVEDAALHAAGRLLDVNMAVGAHAALVLPLARRAIGGEAHAQVGNGADFLAGGSACYGVFECSCGGHVAVGALEPHFWHALCQVTGVQGTLEEAMSTTTSTIVETVSTTAPLSGDNGGGSGGGGGGGGGGSNGGNDGGGGELRAVTLRESMAAMMLTRTAQQWAAALVSAGVPATVVVEPEEAAAHLEQLTKTPVRLTVDIPTKSSPAVVGGGGASSSSSAAAVAKTTTVAAGTTVQLPRLPLCLGTPSTLPGPQLGAHNDSPASSSSSSFGCDGPIK